MDEEMRALTDGLRRLRLALGRAGQESSGPERARLLDLSRQAGQVADLVFRMGCDDCPAALARLAEAERWLERGRGEESCRKIESALVWIDPTIAAHPLRG